MVQTNSIKNKIVIICGPTASGKTELAVECAKLLNSEVISADSMYIYKKLNIGTAKPTKEEMQGVVHHLIDVVNPTDSFSVSDYKIAVEPIINNLHSQGKIPVICGGTGFYINSILYDLSYGNGECNQEVRDKYKNLAAEYGNEYVYNKLKEFDPIAAEKLHFNDLKRVIRAIEIYFNGTKKSEINDNFTPKYDYYAYSIDYPRETLYSRINYRVDKMIENGLISEIQNLLNCGVNKNCQSMQAIGYKEILEFLDGKITLQDAIDLIKLNTRHYAKRQLTFFKKYNLTKLQPDSAKNLAKTIIEGIHYDR